MLETKRVVAYGKRSTRVVYVSNGNSLSYSSPNPKHRISGENTTSTPPASVRKVLNRGRKVHGLSTSPRGSPKSGNIFGLASKKPSDHSKGVTPKRRPFSLKNLSTSPSIVYLGQRSTQTPNPKLNTFAPFVDSDIVVNEEPGGEDKGRSKTGNKDRTHLSQQVKDEGGVEVIRPLRRRAVKKTIITVSDGEDEDVDESTLKRSRRGARANPIVISDDDSDDDPAIVHPRPFRNAAALFSTGTQPDTILEQSRPLAKGNSRRVHADVSILTTNLSCQLKQPRGKGISLPTPDPSKFARFPRRSHRNAPRLGLKKINKPLPSTLDLGRSFTALSSTVDVLPRPQVSHALPGPFLETSAAVSQHLATLLAECAQTTPLCFNTFVETFPFDELHEGNPSVELSFRKIGEATFSEVFAIGNVVLKIIPLRDETGAAQPQIVDIDTPQESDAKDVLQEVVVTRAMGHICSGFIKLLRSYVVVGKYPPSLLSLWDQFNDIKRSENVRPDVFSATQAYALLVLPHGGPDLEAYNFPIKTSWRQACSVFWQTAKALTAAEDLVSFEHRDLHWGQILVKGTIPVRKKAPGALRRHVAMENDDASCVSNIPMDHPSHGVIVTIIDLGLARMDARGGNSNGVHWTLFDDLTFEGKGDYQFDVYRMMRHVHGHGAWDHYCPLTNVMWLHYLTLKLLRSKRLRPPGSRNTAATTKGFNEKQCYYSLIEMEQLLANSIPQMKGKKYRGATKGMFSKAGDVVYFARGRGWLE